MINLSKNQKLIIIGIGIIIVSVISYYIFQRIENSKYELLEIEEVISNLNEVGSNNTVTENIGIIDDGVEETIIVHIAGSVKNSGIIFAKEGARVSDIISLAGGLIDEADISKVNLAYMVEDGQKIYIPSIHDKEEHYITGENGEGIVEQGNIEKPNTVVNINTANQTELETIPGVGPSTANNIINYREENGKYKTIEDIKNVPGIGDSKFENMKSYIKVK